VILNDATIRELAQAREMISPYLEELQNPASYDVRIGRRLMEATPVGWRIHDMSSFSEESPFLLEFGQFYLAETIETFNLPEDVSALFFLKSSRARRGVEHSHAGFCDPGWHGSKLTMELTCVHPYDPIPVWEGMKIGQMVFQETKPVEVSYAKTGRYNGDQTVMPEKPEAA
jgi:dCTP deaminase